MGNETEKTRRAPSAVGRVTPCAPRLQRADAKFPRRRLPDPLPSKAFLEFPVPTSEFGFNPLKSGKNCFFGLVCVIRVFLRPEWQWRRTEDGGRGGRLRTRAAIICPGLLALAAHSRNILGTMQADTPSTPAAANAAATLSDPERWVDEHGDYLFKFALIRLRDPQKAEDAVQETFLAALKGGKSFAGRSAEKSWLTGILKNKIFDYYRKSSRETSFTDLEFYADEENDRFVADGLGKGGWINDQGPQEWPNAGENLDKELFWQTYRNCAGKLPARVAAVFNLREVDGLESREVCALLNLSESNLWVMLHRARMALRRCLETNWFGKQA